MQFYRKWFQRRSEIFSVNDTNTYIDFLNSVGFVNRDTGELLQIPEEQGSSVYWRWKYDNNRFNNLCYGDLIMGNDAFHQVGNFIPSNNSTTFQYYVIGEGGKPTLLNGSPNCCFVSSSSYDIDGSEAIFFFPLKNRGFYYSRYRSCPYLPHLNYLPALTNLDVFPSHSDYQGNLGSSYIMGTLGCFYNNIDNKYNYIITSRLHPNISAIRPCIQIDYNNGHMLVNQILDYYGDYTDVKENVCTLVKFPYQNGFISNLFLVTTSPLPGTINDGNGISNKFFSFNGRNFYGIGYNMAVELPAN